MSLFNFSYVNFLFYMKSELIIYELINYTYELIIYILYQIILIMIF